MLFDQVRFPSASAFQLKESPRSQSDFHSRSGRCTSKCTGLSASTGVKGSARWVSLEMLKCPQTSGYTRHTHCLYFLVSIISISARLWSCRNTEYLLPAPTLHPHSSPKISFTHINYFKRPRHQQKGCATEAQLTEDPCQHISFSRVPHPCKLFYFLTNCAYCIRESQCWSLHLIEVGTTHMDTYASTLSIQTQSPRQ